jgi:hypothetical protein
MRVFARAVLVVSLSAILGFAIGMAPSLARKVAAQQQSRHSNPDKHGFRQGWDRWIAESKARGTLFVAGVFQVGDAEPSDEVLAQHLTVMAADGTLVVNKEMKRINVPAGATGGDYPFEYLFKLDPGTYKVMAFSHTPGHTLTQMDGTVGPAINSYATATVVVR